MQFIKPCDKINIYLPCRFLLLILYQKVSFKYLYHITSLLSFSIYKFTGNKETNNLTFSWLPNQKEEYAYAVFSAKQEQKPKSIMTSFHGFPPLCTILTLLVWILTGSLIVIICVTNYFISSTCATALTRSLFSIECQQLALNKLLLSLFLCVFLVGLRLHSGIFSRQVRVRVICMIVAHSQYMEICGAEKKNKTKKPLSYNRHLM